MTSILKVDNIQNASGTSALSIDSSGIVAQSAKPSFFAYGSSETWQSVSSGGIVTELDATAQYWQSLRYL